MNIDTSKPVMLTGATGYVAGPIVKLLLEAGLTVHCPVRNPDNADRLKYLTDIADATSGSLKFFKADLLEEGSYLESMQGCSVVFHTASPFVMDVDLSKVDEVLLDPAIKGTRNVLESVSKTPSVKRVVLTSSVYAMITDPADSYDQPNNLVTEDTWNTTASRTYQPYGYSKVLAEKEAWKIADAQSQYKLVVVNPAWVMGPGLKCHPSSESYTFIKSMGDGQFKGGAPNMGVYVVDVRDVAKVHMAAGFHEKAEGRYLTVAENTTIPTFGKLLMEKYSDYPLPKSTIPKFLVWLVAPYVGLQRHQVKRSVNYMATCQNKKTIADFGIDYLPLQKTFEDMFQQMIDGGMITKP